MAYNSDYFGPPLLVAGWSGGRSVAVPIWGPEQHRRVQKWFLFRASTIAINISAEKKPVLLLLVYNSVKKRDQTQF